MLAAQDRVHAHTLMHAHAESLMCASAYTGEAAEVQTLGSLVSVILWAGKWSKMGLFPSVMLREQRKGSEILGMELEGSHHLLRSPGCCQQTPTLGANCGQGAQRCLPREWE